MKVLFIGGTGIISSGCAVVALEKGIDLTLLNRGQSLRVPAAGARVLHADFRNTAAVEQVLEGQKYDVVVDWVAYTPDQVQADIDLFGGKVGQYIFISSASAYQTPPANLPIRESTPLDNPVWEYSRNKIACEELLIKTYRESHFPFTIVRPSHTYDRSYIPLPGGYTDIDRMLRGKPVFVPGDGTSIWTLTHTMDFAKGLVGLLGNSRALGEIFHITSDEWLTWNKIYQLLGNAAGVEPELVHIPSDLLAAYDQHIGDSFLGDKAHSAIFDNSKIKQVVPEFQADIPFAEGARQIIEWHLADPSRQKISPEYNMLVDRMLENYQKAWP
ncbi:MAG: SDR family oxidoreductase [Bellilinea sp.]